jgi:hypothetical protein
MYDSIEVAVGCLDYQNFSLAGQHSINQKQKKVFPASRL